MVDEAGGCQRRSPDMQISVINYGNYTYVTALIMPWGIWEHSPDVTDTRDLTPIIPLSQTLRG